MDDTAQRPRVKPGLAMERPIQGVSDLVHLHLDVRAVLGGVQDHTVTGASLLVVMLAGDALRYGAPPVMLRLCRSADGSSLRIEVDDHRPADVNHLPEPYRVTLLNRMTSAHGVERRGEKTTTWADIPVTATVRG